MDDRERRRIDKARLRDEEDREPFAARREEKDLAHDEAVLERQLEQLAEREERAKRDIEEEWRQEHWHHDPDRPPEWSERPPDDPGADAGDRR
jgi:hypothetical protein